MSKRYPCEVCGKFNCSTTHKLIPELESEIKRLKACTDSVGSAAPSEEDLIASGVSFGDWEKGFNAAIEIIERRMFA